jgi:hypothetical protein
MQRNTTSYFVVPVLCLLSFTLCFSLTGCDRAALMKKITPEKDESFAREYADLLRQQRFEQIEQVLDPSISDSNIKGTLARMAGMFPTEEPKSVKVVDLRFLHSPDSSTHSLTFEYEFTDKWLLVNMSIQRKDGTSTITGFNVTPIADSLENVNRFSLVGKGSVQYGMLGLAIIGPLFCLYVLVLCLRNKEQNLRWLWAIFIFFGVGRLAVNWTTGELTFTPLAFHIPCASILAVPAYGPWMLTVSLPLGAILFLIVHDRAAAQSEQRSSSLGGLPPTSSE